MSSVNQHFTFNYSQPGEYRFSHDSVFLARRIFELTDRRVFSPETRALDIGAGCGIVGMDYLFHRRAEKLTVPGGFDFFEIQETYRDHFGENARRLGECETQMNFVNQNYERLATAEFSGRYDLIVSNPPYFLPGTGALSPSHFKNRCRFFIDSDVKTLFLAFANSLKANGEAFLLLKLPLPVLASGLVAVNEGTVRGTPLIRLKKIAALA